jgi:hypothetical protein
MSNVSYGGKFKQDDHVISKVSPSRVSVRRAFRLSNYDKWIKRQNRIH